MKKIVIALILLTMATAKPQEIEAKQNSADAINELDNNSLTMRFFNALDGKPISKAAVTIGSLGEFQTDFEGRVVFTPRSQNEILPVVFTHPEYITSKFEIEIMAGTLFLARYSVSPRMPLGTLRVVLDWSDKPLDLDAHLVKHSGYHISFRNMIASQDGLARLDHDATKGYGPETITVKYVDSSAVYEFFVHDFSNRGDKESDLLSLSRASIKIYGGNNELLQVMKIPENRKGDTWKAFEIRNGKYVPVDIIE